MTQNILVLTLLLLGLSLALLPKHTKVFPTDKVNSKEFYNNMGFFPPELKDTGKAGQSLIGVDVSAWWFFKAQNGNKNAPVVICLAVGPGVSSFVDLANGLGPFKSKVDYGNLNQWWVDNEYPLNSEADVLFVDMMKKGGYSRFTSTWEMSFEKQIEVYFKHIDHIVTKEIGLSADLGLKSINLHGNGYTTKFLPGIAKTMSEHNYKVSGVSASNPLFAPYFDVKGSYLWAVNNGMLSEDVLVEQQRYLEFLPIITRTKDEGAKSSISNLLKILYGDKKVYKPVNMLDVMNQCTAYHRACLKAEYPRTVFMNNPRFQLVSKILQTKFEVIDLKFSKNPWENDLFLKDVTDDYIKLLENGTKILITSGEHNSFGSWYGALEALTTFDWKHRSLFQNENPNRFAYGFAKGAENLGYIKFDNAGFIITERRAKEMVDAIYENLLDMEAPSTKEAKQTEVFTQSL